MWDDSIPSVEDDPEPFEESDPAADVAWTDGQLMRLENEWHRAQRSFAYHPFIGIQPLRGDPPHEYQIDFRLRTLTLNEAGELQYVDEVSIHVWLPPGFPNQPPVARPMTGVFHPNISWEGVYLSNPWQPTDTLADFAAKIGELLAYRTYDPESVVNATAMEWIDQNSGMLPLDAKADFSSYAGGEPLGRIQRMGPATLDQIRRALDDMRFALIGEQDAPTAQDVDAFARQTRAAASLFLDTDIPDNMKEQASEFDDWCRELPASVPLWQYLRDQRAHAGASATAITTLQNAAAALTVGFQELENLVPGEMPTAPAGAVKLIPPMAQLQGMQLKLPPLVSEFETRVATLRGLVEAMSIKTPDVHVAPEGSLGRRLASQVEMVRDTAKTAIQQGQRASTEVQELIRRSRAELVALELVVGWREYMDMFGKARGLEKQISEWGSAGVHAYFISNASGSFGPFQFEEVLDLSGTRIVIRNPHGTQIDVIDAIGQDVLGRGTQGAVMIVLGQAAGTPGHETRFQLTGRCDDLTIQLNFIQKQTLELLGRLHKRVPGATSWCGKISHLFSETQQQQNLREAHRKAGHRWKALMTDMAHLLKFKERVATYHLVDRMKDEVPRIREVISQARARLKDATEKVQAIMGKSSRDPDTDRLVVPPKLAKTYMEELQNRDSAKHEIARMEALLKQIAGELATRLSSPMLYGRPEVPAFRALSPLSDSLTGLQEAMGDAAMEQMIGKLADGLRVHLPINAAPPPPAGITTMRAASPTINASVESDPTPSNPATGEDLAATNSFGIPEQDTASLDVPISPDMQEGAVIVESPGESTTDEAVDLRETDDEIADFFH